jgi:hypothetical protein
VLTCALFLLSLLCFVWLAAAKEIKLKGFEVPKAVHLDHIHFAVDNDLMTPKFSLKRPQLLKHYQKQVRDRDRAGEVR